MIANLVLLVAAIVTVGLSCAKIVKMRIKLLPSFFTLPFRSCALATDGASLYVERWENQDIVPFTKIVLIPVAILNRAVSFAKRLAKKFLTNK